jgi:tryptophanyl-tRNA synthetase
MSAVVLTGDRPTGPLHLGHFVGSLQNRLQLQDTHKQFLIIADLQALTDNFDRPQQVRENIIEVALDYLAVGLDPSRSTFFVQSGVPELSELTVLFLNLVTVARLERNPTVKSEIESRGFQRNIPAGFFVYPISQAADILAFGADVVPIGEDQAPMIEQTNEIASRFNSLYGVNVFKEVRALVGKIGRLPGIDGKTKMSKSAGNSILLSDSSAALRQKVQKMFTDPNHLRVEDPGSVEGNVVFSFLDFFDPDRSSVAELKAHYQRGGLGDSKVKARLVEVLESIIGPMRARREQFAADRGEVERILLNGTSRARETASDYLLRAKKAMCLF